MDGKLSQIPEEREMEFEGELECDFNFCTLSNLFFNNKEELAKKINHLQTLLFELSEDPLIKNNDLVNFCKAVLWFFDEKNEKKAEENTPVTTDHLLILFEKITQLEKDNHDKLFNHLQEKILSLEEIQGGVVGYDVLIKYINRIQEQHKQIPENKKISENKELLEMNKYLSKN